MLIIGQVLVHRCGRQLDHARDRDGDNHSDHARQLGPDNDDNDDAHRMKIDDFGHHQRDDEKNVDQLDR